MMKHILIISLGLWLCENVAAVTDYPRLEDFAYGAYLKLEPGGALYELTLPEIIYNSVMREDIGDLRIFNGLMEVMPHLLRRHPAIAAPSPVPLPVTFTLLPHNAEKHQPQKKQEHNSSVRINTTATATQIDIGNTIAPPPDTTTRYLFDVRSLAQNGQWHHLGDLRLRWEMAPEDGCVIPIQMETSADVIHWHPVGVGTLVDLPLAGQRLKRDIFRPQQWDAYLRLTWQTTCPNLILTAAEVIPLITGIEQERQWRRVAGLPMAATVHDFESGGWMPLDRIRVHLPQPNTVIMAELASRSTSRQGWTLRFRGMLYDLTVNGINLRNEDITPLLATNTRFWRLTVVSSEGGLGSGIPELELGWVPHQLLFVARGAGPYQLAWGSSRWQAAPGAEASLLQQLAATPEYLKVATIGKSFTLAGANALTISSPPLPWSRIILWLLLVLGVIVLGGMARQVYRRIEKNGAT